MTQPVKLAIYEGFRVCVVDPEPLAAWPNNYGVWVDEFEAMGLGDCLEHVWQQAKVYLDSTPTGERHVFACWGPWGAILINPRSLHFTLIFLCCSCCMPWEGGGLWRSHLGAAAAMPILFCDRLLARQAVEETVWQSQPGTPETPAPQTLHGPGYAKYVLALVSYLLVLPCRDASSGGNLIS